MAFKKYVDLAAGAGWRRALWMLCLAGSAAFASTPSQNGARLNSLAYVAANPDVVFAAGEGVYVSKNGGGTWKPVSLPLDLDQVLTDPHDANRVIAFSSLWGRRDGAYEESIDLGATWSKRRIYQVQTENQPIERGNLDGFVMHPKRAGLWVAIVQRGLWRTTDAGQSWSAAAGDSPVPLRGRLVATADGFYAASESQAWRSVDGHKWLPTALPGGTKVEQLAVAGGAVVVRTDERWLRLTENGVWQEQPLLSPYERRFVGGPVPESRRPGRRDYCYPRQSPADVNYVLATCSDGNQPMSGIVDFSARQHSFDGGATWVAIGGKDLPQAWMPTAVALHPLDPATILMAWVTGNVYRSRDHGATWEASDEGLVFPPAIRNIAPYGVLYLQENALNQAVMRSDFPSIRRLVAQGADVNAIGPQGRGALDWSTFMEAPPEKKGAMYRELRTLGARVPVPTRINVEELFGAAAHSGLADVVEDMMRSGWRLTDTGEPDGAHSALSLATKRCYPPAPGAAGSAPCTQTLAGKPLGYWVDLHLSMVPPGESARLQLDLLKMDEMALATRVAQRDAGAYRRAEDLSRLLSDIPAEKTELRALALRLGPLEPASEEVARSLVNDLIEAKAWDAAETAMKRNAGVLRPHLRWFMDLFFEAGQAQRARALPRKAGIRLSPDEEASAPTNTLTKCSLPVLDQALGAGFRLGASVSSGWGIVRDALASCVHKPAAQADVFIARLHRMGHRLPRHEWNVIDEDERALLVRSAPPRTYVAFEGQTGGVGLRWAENRPGDYPRIGSVIPGFPADMAGLRAGDEISHVDGAELRELSNGYASAHLRGKPGSRVSLTVLRDGKKSQISTRRRELPSQ